MLFKYPRFDDAGLRGSAEMTDTDGLAPPSVLTRSANMTVGLRGGAAINLLLYDHVFTQQHFINVQTQTRAR